MIVRCPNCNSALEYDIETDKMVCRFCNSSYLVGEVKTKEEKKSEEHTKESPKEKADDIEEDTMECKVYNCSSCGAQLLINDVESSTYCAYCGHPTVVFDRVSKVKRPKYIIPFKISRDKALSIINERMDKGMFIPNELRNLKVDLVRGIYIPYWLIDMEYEDRMVIKGKVKRGKSTVTKTFNRYAKTKFLRLPIDGSKKLNDMSSRRLEPYYSSEVKKFSPQYLSGYYADCSDETNGDVDGKGFIRAKKMLEERVLDSVNATNKRIISQYPKHNITQKDYVLFPAWFVIFRHEGISHTLMVNGQTGKLVGAVPLEKKSVSLFFILLSAIVAMLSIPFFNKFIIINSVFNMQFLVMLAFAIAILFGGAYGRLLKFRRSRELTLEERINDYVSDRQEGGL